MVDTSTSDEARTPEETAAIEVAEEALEAAVVATATDNAETEEV